MELAFQGGGPEWRYGLNGAPGKKSGGTAVIITDAHVHVHDCFDVNVFLKSAAANFRKEARRNDWGHDFSGCLLLTESAGADWFSSVVEKGGEKTGKDAWTFHHTGENESLLARSADGDEIYVIAGRQIVTSENLEVLALATAQSFTDGMPIADVIESVNAVGALAAIPWGFGKWMGKRGAMVTRLLETSDPALFFLGDNGGRPGVLSYPAHFHLGEQLGFRILPGSDPLPFVSEAGKAGSRGFILEGRIGDTAPAAFLKQALLDSTSPIRSYGTLETPLRFIRNQIRMQIHKRTRKRKG